MKSVFLIPAILAVAAWSEPVSCALLPKDRAIDKPGCRCAVNTTVDGKMKVTISACGNHGEYSGEHYEFKSDSVSIGWFRVMYRACVPLSGTKKFSCKTYNYLKDNYKEDPLYESFTFADLKEDVKRRFPDDDVEYLFGKR